MVAPYGSGEVTLAGVALVGAEPFVLFAEEGLFGLPDVFAAEREAECLEAHRVQGAVAGEDDQVGPRDLVAVLLLDRPQQPARLVQAHVVRPAVERGEPLHALAAAAAAVLNAVGAGGVPAHPDEQAAVVAVVGGPPVLGGGHHRDHVRLEGVDVELGELRRRSRSPRRAGWPAGSAGAASTRRSGRATSPGWSGEHAISARGRGLPGFRFRCLMGYRMTQHSFRGWVNRAAITGVIRKLQSSSRGTGPSR